MQMAGLGIAVERLTFAHGLPHAEFAEELDVRRRLEAVDDHREVVRVQRRQIPSRSGPARRG